MANISFSLQDHISLLFSRCACPCYIPCLSRAPPSPTLTPQEGELEGLLRVSSGWRDDEMDDALSLQFRHGTPRRKSPSQTKDRTYRTNRGMALFAGRGPKAKRVISNPPPYTSDGELTDHENEPIEFDTDAPCLDRTTLDKLPELARRFEPTLTLEDIAREEAAQALRERRAERASGLEIYSPPANEEEDDFGGFEQATESRNGHTPDHIAAGSGDEERHAMDEDDEDAAEVSFGLRDGVE